MTRRTAVLFLIAVTLILGVSLAVASLTGATSTDKPSPKPEPLLSQPLTVRWSYQSDGTLNLTPAADAERIYVPLSGGTIVALKAHDGQLIWRSDMGGELSAAPVADESTIFVASETTGPADEKVRRPAGALRALGREGGVTLWMTPLIKPLRGALTVSGVKLFAGGSDGRAYAFDKRSGGVFWSIPFPSAFSSQPVCKDGRVYFGSEDGTLLALEETTGRILWRYKTTGAIRGPVAVSEDRVFLGSGDGYVYALTADKGKIIWRKRTGAGVEAVRLSGDSILAASLDNFAYLLNLKGKMLWKKQLPGRISAQPLTVEDEALFTPLSSNAAVVLSLKDGKQMNTLPTEDELTSSAAAIVVGDAVIITTEHSLVAFARSKDSKPSSNETKPTP